MNAKHYAADSQGREIMTPLLDYLDKYLTGKNKQCMAVPRATKSHPMP